MRSISLPEVTLNQKMSHFSTYFGQFLSVLLQFSYEQLMDISGLDPSGCWYAKCNLNSHDEIGGSVYAVRYASLTRHFHK